MPAKRSHAVRPLSLSAEVVFQGIPSSGVLDPDGVHRVRRAAKRTRAILRLAEDSGQPRIRRIRRALAKTLRPLGPLRDAVVAKHVAEKLMTKVTGAPQALARTLAEGALPAPNSAWWDRRWSAVAASRRDFIRLRASPVAPADWAAGLARAARRILRRHRRAEKDRADLRKAHAWRKSLMVLREQLRALDLPPKSELRTLHDRLHELTQVLGKAIDGELFLSHLRNRSVPKDQHAAARELAQRTRRKQARALDKAHRKWHRAKQCLRILTHGRKRVARDLGSKA